MNAKKPEKIDKPVDVAVVAAPFLTETMKSAIITGIFALCMAYLNYRTQLVVEKTAKDAAVKVEKVKENLELTNAATDAKLTDIVETGDKVHILVNNNMAIQLKVSALALRRVAELTKDPMDIDAAEVAEKAYRDHQVRQGVVDRGEDSEKSKPAKPKAKPDEKG